MVGNKTSLASYHLCGLGYRKGKGHLFLQAVTRVSGTITIWVPGTVLATLEGAQHVLVLSTSVSLPRPSTALPMPQEVQLAAAIFSTEASVPVLYASSVSVSMVMEGPGSLGC